MTNPTNALDVCKGTHEYVTRPDGTRGYVASEPAEVVYPEPAQPSAADLDAVAEEQKAAEATEPAAKIRMVKGSKAE